MITSQRMHRLRRGLALPLALILALLLPLGAWAWTGTGHFVLDSIGYTDGAHARAYTVAPNFRQASGSLNQANSAISSEDAADVYVNFDYDTAGKSVYVVYTTDGSAPNKSNGTSVTATFSKYAEPNRTWYATIPAQAVGTTINYVFYISDSDLASAWGRISGATADRNTSQYETGWDESDGDYFTYGVCGKAITVTSDADSGAGSLRQAIVDACPGGSITFGSDTSITLASELSLDKRLTIDGGSQAVTISGNHTWRVFNVNASGVVTLSHLSIVSGTVTSSGGGIYSKGVLTVQHCVLSDNVSDNNSGGIYNEGVLTVQNSVLSGNQAGAGGGGIGNSGSLGQGMLTLRDSTLSGNSAGYGGGLFNTVGGQITLYNSTLSGNSATGTVSGGGGAIDQYGAGADTTIINSTLVSNTAVSPYQAESGIWLETGVLTLTNSIVAHNNGANNFKQEAGTTFTSQGYNLSNAWNGLTIQPTDLTADPLLGPLEDNGGPSAGSGQATLTHALLANSPAIDAIPVASCLVTTDQRGVARPQPTSGNCDIGAYEFGQPLLALTKSVTPTTSVPYHGAITYTLTLSNTGVGDDTALLTDTLPTSTTFASWIISPTNTALVNREITWNGLLTAGHTLTWTWTMTHTGNYAEVITNTAEFSGSLQSGEATAEFHIIPAYVITPTAGTSGSVSPNTLQTVGQGDDITFTITPDTGYHITDVLVDGASQGTIASYTFTNVTANHTISAAFAINTYAITPTAGTGGSISPATTQTVNHGDDITFTITPAPGYHITDVLVDGASQGVIASYTFEDVIANHTLNAAFAQDEYTLTVNSTGSGTVTWTPSQTTYLYGDDVTLTATPDTDWYFGQWSGDASSTLTQTTITMNADKVVTATFVAGPATYYTLTLSIVGNGVITPEAGTHSYLAGTNVNLSASPASGWQFDGWSGDLESTSTPAQITMATDQAITATFSQRTYTLTPTAGVGGSISPATAQTVAHGATLTFTITPATGYHIADVLVDGASVGAVDSYTFHNITTDHTISATFAVNEYTLMVNTIGSGSVTHVPSQTTYTHGEVVTLTATPDTGWYFGQWTGDATGTLTQTTVTMTGNKVVTATFVTTPPTYYTLTMNVVGSGVITPGVGTHSYLSGTVVDLSANPAEGWQFDGWSGDLESTRSPAPVTMDADKVITATFSLIPSPTYTLTVHTVGQGTVTLDPPGGVYDAGTAVTLTATADSGAYFGQWSGAATGILTQTTITLDTNKVVTATFIETPPTYYTLTLSIVGSGIITPATGMHPYLSGTQVDLSANPAEGWKFDGWSGDLESTSNLAQVTMNTDKTVTATFSLSATTNHTPTASAGPDRHVMVGDEVTLDGSGSSDPDTDDTLTYSWVQTGGDTVTLSDANIESPTFTATTTGTLTFTLTVTDSGGLADSDNVSIMVTEKRYQTFLPLILK